MIDFNPMPQNSYNISVQFMSGGNSLENLPQKKSFRPKSNDEPHATSTASSDPQASQQGGTILGRDIGINAQYPKLSRMMEESGQVIIEVIQNSDSSTVRVLESSGFARLDESALSATRSALKNGILTSFFKNQNRMQMSFIFRLKN